MLADEVHTPRGRRHPSWRVAEAPSEQADCPVSHGGHIHNCLSTTLNAECGGGESIQDLNAERRIPKAERRPNSEARKGLNPVPRLMAAAYRASVFGFRISFGLRASGIRIC